MLCFLAYIPLLYPSGLENLPGEVTFLLEEIREKDVRISRELFISPLNKV